ncbi:MAG: hypothetical protein GPJ54_22195 [Candidatus Heimdallarchaeota archaeon]|nr:hypothetical protein [Candidatus Heimdallarchaeota archaeon]
MIEASIQVRRITNKVKKFYELFGFRHFIRYQNGRAIIKGGKRLGLDEIECVVADTARGTTVGFYKINTLQGLFYSLPFLGLILIQLLNRVDFLDDYISGGNNPLSINLLTLFTGNGSLNYTFVFSVLFIALLPWFIDYSIQTIRVANIKARFSFYSKSAVWETREIPTSLIILQSIKSAFTQAYLLAIFFFAIFAFDDTSVGEVVKLYRTSEESLLLATQTTFSLTVGIVIGLLSADKAIKLQKQISTYDKRQRISGSSLERKLEPILLGIQAAIYSAFVFSLFLSTTFFSDAPFSLSIQFITFAILGGIVAGIIHQEEQIWLTSIYAVVIFFTSILFIFRTGSNPEYAFLVILQLFLIPLPFIIHYSTQFRKSLLENGIDTFEWLYDFIPIMGMYSIYIQNKRQKQVKDAYEAELDKSISLSELDERGIAINKLTFQDSSSSAYKLARHYFELIISYTASFEENVFVIIPTSTQLYQWWVTETKIQSDESKIEMIDFIDKLLWDNDFQPPEVQISEYEKVAKEMVITLQ